MNLQNYIPKEHHLKKFFKQYECPLGLVAAYVGLSYSYMSNILNGRMTPTPEVEEKLNKLADELRKSEDN
jgi:transcriptional regulator with XRE-family HTH domain